MRPNNATILFSFKHLTSYLLHLTSYYFFMDFKDIVQKRRSIRRFTEQELSPEQTQTILRAALMSPTSKSTRAWRFIVVDDKQLIHHLAISKSMGADFIDGAPIAVLVLMDTSASDVWVEDASIAAVTMQYQATELGLGSCWAQLRLRGQEDGTSADDYLRSVFNYPDNFQAECVIAFGYPAIERKLQDEDKLKWEAVSINQF